MSWRYAARTIWTCDKCGVVEDGRYGSAPPKGWVTVPVMFGPETHHLDHHCPACVVPPEAP